MTNLVLVLNMLAEASTTEISKKHAPKSLFENKKVAKKGGSVAKKARNELEKNIGESIISNKSLKYLQKKNKKI